MDRNRINSGRVVAVVGFVFLLTATIISILLDGDPNSIIEKIAPTAIVIPIVHGICLILTIVCIIKPSPFIMVSILLLESELTILTNYEELGIFFFYAALILILCKDILSNKDKKHLFGMFGLHLLTLLLTYTHGVVYMLVSIGYSMFWIYSILKAKLSCLIPQNVRENNTVIGKPAGSVISLSDYNLNERQRTFLMEHIHDKTSYKELSEKHFVSLSTVKKEFADIFRVFNVSNIEELRILLLQYQVKE